MSSLDFNALLQSAAQWYEGLSLVGKFIFPALGIALLVLVAIIFRGIYISVLLARRFIRRKLIPKKADLRLDRDLAHTERVEPSLSDEREDAEPEPAASLKERIERMHMDDSGKQNSS